MSTPRADGEPIVTPPPHPPVEGLPIAASPPWPAPPGVTDATFAVGVFDGICCVIGPTGEVVPIRLNGDPVCGFDPGWTALHVVPLFAPVHLLALQHERGHQASWYLDGQMNRVGGPVRTLPPELLGTLRRRTLDVFRPIVERLLTSPVPMPMPVAESAGFAAICLGTLLELLDWVLEELLPALHLVDLREPDAAARLQALGLRPDLVQASLAGSLQADYSALLRGGTMPGLSPIDGSPAVAQAGLLLPERRTAYRFVDACGRHSFYVATFGYHDIKAALYVPELGLCCVAAHVPEPRGFLLNLIAHMAIHQRWLVPCLSMPPAARQVVSFVSDFPVVHIGHLVWNELSAIEELVQALPPRDLPMVCVLNAPDGSEIYGPLDRLFPELAGRVLRPRLGALGEAAFVYENGLFPIRATTQYVRAAVGRRIQAQVLRDPRLDDDAAMARRLRDDGRPCILLGLRVGNRTIPDFAGFLADAIDHLVRRLGPITVVLDGSNARLGLDATTSYGSFGPAGPEEPLIEELRLVLALRRRYSGRTVTIVSTVGAPIACSLFWIMQSRFFLAPWGAGLAKYRWVCNKPGFVVTNRHNLAHPSGDLPIYHAPSVMEAPTPMHLVGIEHVADAPGHQGFYANFLPDAAAVAAGLDRLIAETADDPAATRPARSLRAHAPVAPGPSGAT